MSLNHLDPILGYINDCHKETHPCFVHGTDYDAERGFETSFADYFIMVNVGI